MKTLKINIPDTVDFDDQEARMAIAARMYEKGKLTLGQAADLVGLSKSAFMELLASYGVSVINHPASELERDAEHAKRHHR